MDEGSPSPQDASVEKGKDLIVLSPPKSRVVAKNLVRICSLSSPESKMVMSSKFWQEGVPREPEAQASPQE